MTKNSDHGSQEKERKHYKADYKGATPRQVAEAVLRYRPQGESKKENRRRVA